MTVSYKTARLAKELREKGIHINIKHRPHSQTFCFDITGSYYDGDDGVLSSKIFHKYKTYEEALEEGLKEALMLINFVELCKSKGL